ncbi:hypothetical protein [Hydrococcus rivularis]|uniref:hypothetical protein n=1 Tax=Hydrococcus rivularis TaxID=1616834 RepID=UPI000B1B6539|nr:hypothetical protein [Hydrococcus rivularis]
MQTVLAEKAIVGKVSSIANTTTNCRDSLYNLIVLGDRSKHIVEMTQMLASDRNLIKVT